MAAAGAEAEEGEDLEDVVGLEEVEGASGVDSGRWKISIHDLYIDCNCNLILDCVCMKGGRVGGGGG